MYAHFNGFSMPAVKLGCLYSLVVKKLCLFKISKIQVTYFCVSFSYKATTQGNILGTLSCMYFYFIVMDAKLQLWGQSK